MSSSGAQRSWAQNKFIFLLAVVPAKAGPLRLRVACMRSALTPFGASAPIALFNFAANGLRRQRRWRRESRRVKT